jgi:hypothetical protein
MGSHRSITPSANPRHPKSTKPLAEAGADGFVFGFLDDDGHVDVAATGKLVHVMLVGASGQRRPGSRMAHPRRCG